MNNYVLKIDELEIELTEIEFYYFECNNHQDLYVHLDKLQRQKGKLYVHKKGKGYGGIDLTFGNGSYFGGILIRGIKSSNIFISGPAKVREYIAEKLNIENEYLKLQELFDNIENKISLEEKRNNKKEYEILHSTRIGLNEEVDEKFYNALYRFIREDNKEFKNSAKIISYLTNLIPYPYKTPNSKSIKDFEEKLEIIKMIEKFKECQKNLQENKN
jgi:hypothetical protein